MTNRKDKHNYSNSGEIIQIELLLKEANQRLTKGEATLQFFSEKNHLQFYSLLLDTLK